MREAFVQGLGGYADDRLADGAGWTTFDVGAIYCSVAVLHGTRDTLAPVAHAHHTAAIVLSATLRVLDDLGHFSVIPEVVGTVRELLDRR
jgi:pimeloyl-ACP methyl ester carboxylesterase